MRMERIDKSHEAPPTRYRPALILAGVAAPAALAGYHFISYAAMPWICLRQAQALLWIGAGGSILLALAGLAAGLIVSIQGGGAPDDAPGPGPRGAFMGSVMALFSSLLLLVLLGQAAATLILDPCQK
jgi:hypothetical protein